MPWSLTIVAEDGSTRSFPLGEGTIRIGRHSDNEIALKDRYVSRFQLEITRVGEGWQLIDLGSKSGTFVRGERVTQPVYLEAGDEIALGRSVIHVVGPKPLTRPDETVVFVDAIPTEGTIRVRRVTDSPETGLSRILVSAAKEIGTLQPAESILPRLLGLALKATGAERGVIATFSSDGELVVASMAGAWPSEHVAISRQVLSRVRDQGEAVIVEDIPSDAELKDAGTIISAGLRSVLCTPLGTSSPPRGVLYLDSRTSQVTFDPSHFEVVTTLAGMIDVTCENSAARAALREKERNEEELRTAKTIMQRLVPPGPPVPPAGYNISGSHTSCLTIGGDFFSFFSHRSCYGVALADVAGKGLSAALLVANFHAVWHHVLGSDLPPEAWLENLNEELAAYMPDNRFITLAFAIVDPDRDEILVASAGHNPVLLVDPEGGFDAVLPGGPVLGLMAGLPYACERRPFLPGSRVVLNSDGVTDQFDSVGEEFGQDRLDAIVRQHGTLDAEALLAKINGALAEHMGDAAQMDDTTVAILGRQTGDEPGPGPSSHQL